MEDYLKACAFSQTENITKKDIFMYANKNKNNPSILGLIDGLILRDNDLNVINGLIKQFKDLISEDDIVLAIPGTKWQEGKIPETISLKDAKSKGIDLKNYFNTKELNIPTSSLINKLTEDESLHKWFSRQGGEGKSRGWVDCNTCRKDPKTGRKKCKPCGRQKGEKRAKYPSCRPTPSQCSREGKGKTWGKTK